MYSCVNVILLKSYIKVVSCCGHWDVESAMSEAEPDPLQEIEAMRVIAGALMDLAPEARGRVLRWAATALQTSGATNELPRTPAAVLPGALGAPAVGTEHPKSAYASIADLYAATRLGENSGDAERALVAAYWFQVVQEEQDFDSQSINTALKHLGHGVSNITQALGTLISRKPQLVIQTRKAGATQQARKRYKLTLAGQQAVERLFKTGGGISEAPEV